MYVNQWNGKLLTAQLLLAVPDNAETEQYFV